MKKYESIKNRVSQMEKKQGLIYATADSRIFKNFRLCLYLVYLYKLIMDLIYISGSLFMNIEAGRDIDVNVFNAICIFTAIMIIGRIFLYIKQNIFKIIGIICMVISLCGSVLTYSRFMVTAGSIRPAFYFMHLAPAILIFILSVWLLVIIIRAIYLYNSHYKSYVANLYQDYQQKHGNINDINCIDESDWEEFLENYDPEIYKKQF